MAPSMPAHSFRISSFFLIFFTCSIVRSFFSYHQTPESLYRTLDDSTLRLRFTLPFPLFAYPVYLVRSNRLICCFFYLFSHSFLNKSSLSHMFMFIFAWFHSCGGHQGRQVPTSTPTASCLLQMRDWK